MRSSPLWLSRNAASTPSLRRASDATLSASALAACSAAPRRLSTTGSVTGARGTDWALSSLAMRAVSSSIALGSMPAGTGRAVRSCNCRSMAASRGLKSTAVWRGPDNAPVHQTSPNTSNPPTTAATALPTRAVLSSSGSQAIGRRVAPRGGSEGGGSDGPRPPAAVDGRSGGGGMKTSSGFETAGCAGSAAGGSAAGAARGSDAPDTTSVACTSITVGGRRRRCCGGRFSLAMPSF
jgi:hypothetical protein